MSLRQHRHGVDLGDDSRKSLDFKLIRWIFSFLGFAIIYLPMLIKPRIDGQYG